MLHETNNAEIFREKLRELGYYNPGLRVEEQFSNVGRIPELLSNASKQGMGGGRPDFIITNQNEPNIVIVVECKTLNSQHEQAIDEVKHYSKFLHGHYDIIELALSGATEDTFKATTLIWRKDEENYFDANISNIRRWGEYSNIISNSEKAAQELTIKINEITAEFNSILTNMSISMSHKMLLVSALLLGLKDPMLMAGYNKMQNGSVFETLLTADKNVLKAQNIPTDKVENIIDNLKVLKTYDSLERNLKITPKATGVEIEINPIIYLLSVLDKSNIILVIDKHNTDIMGQFYNTFIRYATGDTKLGFVLTPSHICQLFVELAELTPETKILDLCCGTGGFLVASMTDEINKANGDLEKIKYIKANNFYGVENSGDRYTYACINMILRGDGQSNLIHDDCFNVKDIIKKKQCQVGFINPPYRDKKNKSSKYEFEFVEELLDSLTDGGTGIVIIPHSCSQVGQRENDIIKERILSKHTLVASMTMPQNLFQPVAAVGTIIMVFKAHIPHNSAKKAWFADWSDDGFIVSKNKRFDPSNSWPDILNTWISEYMNQDEIEGHSIKQSVTATDEWNIESYRTVDYTTVTQADFQKAIQQYVGFLISDMDFS